MNYVENNWVSICKERKVEIILRMKFAVVARNRMFVGVVKLWVSFFWTPAHSEEADAPFVKSKNSVVHKRKVARDIRFEFNYAGTTRGNKGCLDATSGRRDQVAVAEDLVEDCADDMKR